MRGAHWILEVRRPDGLVVHRQNQLTVREVRKAFYRATGGDIEANEYPWQLEYVARWEKKAGIRT